MAKIKNMEEFAALSGVSRPTISKYFHDPASVRDTTRERIEEALEQYDYRPNIYAINQNRKLTKNVGVVVPYLADPFFAEIARSIEQRCLDAGYRPSLFSSHGDPSLEVDILNGLRSLKPAGVLLAPLARSANKSLVAKFARDVPTVLFDSNVPDVGAAFVGSDNPQLSMLIVDYLCRTGEPPCFFEMKNPSNPNANKRRQSYYTAMEALGHEPHVVSVEGDGWGFEEIGREHGLRVGRSADSTIRVAGQDDHPFARFTCPPLTTVAQNYDLISQYTVEALLSAMQGGKESREIKLFEGKLVMRQSA